MSEHDAINNFPRYLNRYGRMISTSTSRAAWNQKQNSAVRACCVDFQMSRIVELPICWVHSQKFTCSHFCHDIIPLFANTLHTCEGVAN